MSDTVTLRNVSPHGFLNVPLIDREGDAPYLKECERCHPQHPEHFNDTVHLHTEIVDEHLGEPGSGCLVPGEEFEVTKAEAEELLGPGGESEHFEIVKGSVDTPKAAVPMSKWKVPQLREFAAEHGIDLTGVTKKVEIVNAILAGQSPGLSSSDNDETPEG